MAIIINHRELLKGVALPGFPDIPEFDLSQTGLNATGKDALGRPFFMDVEFTSVDLGSFRLPNEPLVRVSKRKNLVKTIIAGHGNRTGGMVVEQVNYSNYQIDIRGIILNKNYTTPAYPQQDVERLVNFCDASEPLTVECDLLENLFGIRKLVIEDYSLDSMQGKPYSQIYTLSCFSYEDFLAHRNKRLP